MADDYDDLSPQDYLQAIGYEGDPNEQTYKEALQMAMDKMFDDSEHDGTVCHRQWCQDMGECLWVTLQGLQQEFAELFYGGELPADNYLISNDDVMRCMAEGCDLSEDWYDYGSYENEAISLVLELLQTLQYSSQNQDSFDQFIMSEDSNDFGQNLYNLLKFSLLEKDSSSRREVIKKLQEFLEQSTILNAEDISDFSIRLGNL